MGETTAAAEAKPPIPTFGRERLAPGAYTLDFRSPVWGAPVTFNGRPSTLAEVYRKLKDSKVKEIAGFDLDPYITEEGEIRLDGEIAEWTLRATMRELAGLLRQGIDPFQVTWFYYDHDYSRDADESYSFFAVHDGKIVEESSSFSCWQPRVLKRCEPDAEPIWHSHPYFDEALEQYWYRKFYSETMTGQLMVLRPDKPILYHYERPEARDTVRDVELVTLAKIYRLVLVLIPLLAAIAFPTVREYAAGGAVVLGGVYLLICWRTRKVGRL